MPKEKKICYVIANFGGPRNIPEVRPFLKALLTDTDVIRTLLPKFLQKWLFTIIASRRSIRIAKDYAKIGGKSPIYEDTEAVAEKIREKVKGAEVITFHRYLKATHSDFLSRIKNVECDEYRVFPMFPQFTYATTGSIARWFSKTLPKKILSKIRWVKSYAAHPQFIAVQQKSIRDFLTKHQLHDAETILLFSAHGIPESYVTSGDIYRDECEVSYEYVMKAFPAILGRLSFQSRFGSEEWIKPYTIDVCEEIKLWSEGRKNVVFIPISFTSDHIETLFEIEQDYMTVIKEQGLQPYRVPCLTLNSDWMNAIHDILQEPNYCNNEMLIRKE
jgi:protoporphyrin/coproporphyrin ferrochelatase